MPLIAATIQQSMSAAIEAALDTQLPEGIKADPTSHQKMAAAIAEGVTQVLITALLTEAEVLPGIVTVGSPVTQTTTTPGKIF